MPLVSIEGNQAWQLLRGDTRSWWPNAARSPDRIVPYARPQVRPKFRLEANEKIFTVGSCFARNIEEHLRNYRFQVPALGYDALATEFPHRPHGILNKYHPHSMLNEFRWALGDTQVPAANFVEVDDGLVLDLQLPQGAHPVPRQRALERRREITGMFGEIRNSGTMLLTLGLIEAWWDSETGLYTNSTVRDEVIGRHPGRFHLHVLSFEEVSSVMKEIVTLVRQAVPDIKIVLTVSPVPLNATFTGQDVMVANAYSKAVLRAAVEQLVLADDRIQYFPSYESVVLTERDQAFGEDLIHVRNKLVQYNVETFVEQFTQAA